MANFVKVPLHQIAHSRAGDKGTRLNVSLISYEKENFNALVEQVTAERVKELFAHRRCGEVRRYVLPKVGAMNFVIDDVLEGGVNGSLNLDGHGKSLSFLLLGLTISMPSS
jgi:hypothetical protein